MSTFTNYFMRLTATILALFLGLGIFITPASYSVEDEQNIKLNLTLFSDVHMEGNNKENRNTFIKSLQTLKGSESKIDALVMIGDNTMNGQNIENLFYYGVLETQCPVDTYLPCMGNHDVGNGEGNYSQLYSRYLSYFKAFVDPSAKTPYYCKVINGYYLIFMAGDSSESNSRDMSDAQLNWFETVLDEAHEGGNPIFVFNHHPYSSVNQGGDRYQSLLTKYDNIISMVGHMHYYINQRTIRGEQYDTPEIWVPSILMNDIEGERSVGVQLEVYENEVVFRYRNFLDGKWLNEVRYDV